MLLPCLRSDFSIQPRTTIQPPEQRSPPTLMQLHNIPVAVLRCNPQSCQSILVCCIFALSPIRMELRSIEPSQSHMGFMAFMCPMTHMHCSILLEVKGLKFKVWVADPDIPEPIANPQDGVKQHDGNKNDLQTAMIFWCKTSQIVNSTLLPNEPG